MSNKNKNEPKRPSSARSEDRRRSKIFQLFHPTNIQLQHEQQQQSQSPTIHTTQTMKHSQHKRSQSTITQFNKLTSAISGLFPKNNIRIKPKKSHSANRKSKSKSKPKSKTKTKSKPKKPHVQRSKSFSFRRKKKRKNNRSNKNLNEMVVDNSIPSLKNRNIKSNAIAIKQHKIDRSKRFGHKRTESCNINTMSTNTYDVNCDSFKKRNTISIHPTLSSTQLLHDVIVEEDVDILSATEEYKKEYDICSDYNIENHNISNTYDTYISCDTPPMKPQLPQLQHPKSHSFMRSFEKRPEYITYYPPASLADIFNNITVDEDEQAVTVETKNGIKTRIDAVDQLFELAEMTLDYSHFYGYSPDHELNQNQNSNHDQNNNDDDNHNMIDMNNNYPIMTDEYQLNEPSLQRDVSVLSSVDDDLTIINDKEYQYNLSWQ